MKKIKIIFAALAMTIGAAAQAQSVGDLLKGLGGGDTSSTLSNIIEGVFTKSDLTTDDLVGSYESTGPAVAFKSDNFLQKAGGLAGAAAIETKLQPYYEQYGLTGMTLSVDKDANFSMVVKGLKLNGNITRNDDDGTFSFNLVIFGQKLGHFTAYVEKSGKNLNLMFDAKKLKDIISMVGKFSGVSIAKTLSSLLDSYEGACIGFKMQSTGSSDNSNETINDSDSQSGLDSEGGIDALRDLLTKKKK